MPSPSECTFCDCGNREGAEQCAALEEGQICTRCAAQRDRETFEAALADLRRRDIGAAYEGASAWPELVRALADRIEALEEECVYGAGGR
jgi:hypothetical protein